MRLFHSSVSCCLLAFASAPFCRAIYGQVQSVPVPSPVQALIERYAADRGTLESVYADPLSPTTRVRMGRFDTETRKQLEGIDFAARSVL